MLTFENNLNWFLLDRFRLGGWGVRMGRVVLVVRWGLVAVRRPRPRVCLGSWRESLEEVFKEMAASLW